MGSKSVIFCSSFGSAMVVFPCKILTLEIVGHKNPPFLIFIVKFFMVPVKKAVLLSFLLGYTVVMVLEIVCGAEQIQGKVFWRFELVGALFLSLKKAKFGGRSFVGIFSIREATTAHEYPTDTSVLTDSGLELGSCLSRSTGKGSSHLVRLLPGLAWISDISNLKDVMCWWFVFSVSISDCCNDAMYSCFVRVHPPLDVQI